MFAGNLGLGEDLATWTPSLIQQARQEIALYREVAPYLNGNYSSLRGQPTTIHDWAGWEFHNPQGESGVLSVFRLESADAQRHFPMRGLEATRNYAVEELGSQNYRVFTGRELTDPGLAVTIERHDSKVFRWWRQ